MTPLRIGGRSPPSGAAVVGGMVGGVVVVGVVVGGVVVGGVVVGGVVVVAGLVVGGLVVGTVVVGGVVVAGGTVVVAPPVDPPEDPGSVVVTAPDVDPGAVVGGMTGPPLGSRGFCGLNPDPRRGAGGAVDGGAAAPVSGWVLVSTSGPLWAPKSGGGGVVPAAISSVVVGPEPFLAGTPGVPF